MVMVWWWWCWWYLFFYTYLPPPQSIFPFASLELQVPKLCKKWGGDKNTVLVLQAPCNDITNCSKMEKKAQEKMARCSSENTLTVASDAMVKFGIQKVLILARPRRNDQMEKLSTLSNEILRELCFERNGIFFLTTREECKNIIQTGSTRCHFCVCKNTLGKPHTHIPPPNLFFRKKS